MSIHKEVELLEIYSKFEKVLENFGLEDFSIEIDFENGRGGYAYRKRAFVKVTCDK